MAELFDDFLVRAFAAGIAVALVAGPMGCFVVWRRMAYFGDTMAHAALLGISLGFVAGIAPMTGVALVTLAIALILVFAGRQRWLSSDALLGILSHTALSAGVIVIGLLPSLRVDLMGYLFGDILAVGHADLAWIAAGGTLALLVLAAIWRPLLAVTLDEDLARAEGVAAAPVRLVFMVLMALVIALAMKVVGVLLITSLLIIPAATARRFARTPEQMAVLAAALAVAAVGLGLGGSLAFDTPSGPSIVVGAALLFAASLIPARLAPAARRPGGG